MHLQATEDEFSEIPGIAYSLAGLLGRISSGSNLQPSLQASLLTWLVRSHTKDASGNQEIMRQCHHRKGELVAEHLGCDHMAKAVCLYKAMGQVYCLSREKFSSTFPESCLCPVYQGSPTPRAMDWYRAAAHLEPGCASRG